MSLLCFKLTMAHMRDGEGHDHKEAKVTVCLKTTPKRVKSCLVDMAM
jgi:hypothetical protein